MEKHQSSPIYRLLAQTVMTEFLKIVSSFSENFDEEESCEQDYAAVNGPIPSMLIIVMAER